MYEPESDITNWGINIFDVDPVFSAKYYGDSSHDVRIDCDQYSRDSCYDSVCRNIDSDELVARALQEELSELSIADAPELSHPGVEYDSVQDWHSPSRDFYPGDEVSPEETDDVGLPSSWSSPDDESYNREEHAYSLEITDESDLDGEVGKRLNQMIPVPHTPRINGDIPSVDEATSDHQRLIDRLQLYDLIEHRVEGDGNCQFRALSDQIYRTPEHHKFVRQQVVKQQLKAHPEMYEGYVPMPYGDYLRKLSKSGEWGDHVTLQAASDSYGVKILVITSFRDTCYIEILPKIQNSKRVIYLSFWAEVHYNSIYPQGDLPPCDDDLKKKKKCWNFRNKH